MNVKFPMFNRHNKNIAYFIDLNDPDNVKNFKINKNEKLFFITHGYLESGDRPWVGILLTFFFNEFTRLSSLTKHKNC